MKAAIYDPATGLVRQFSGGLDAYAVQVQVQEGESWKAMPEEFQPAAGVRYAVQAGELVALPNDE